MSQMIYPFKTDAPPSLSEVGGKARSLIRTTGAGLPVPGGLALTGKGKRGKGKGAGSVIPIFWR